MINYSQKLKKVGLFGILPIFAMIIFLPLFNPQIAAAATTGEWIDKAKIKVVRDGSEIIFTDNNPYDDDNNWAGGRTGGGGDCRHNLDVENFSGSGTQAKIKFKTINGANNCPGELDEEVTITLANPQKRFVNGYRIDANNIWLPFELKDRGCATGAFQSNDDRLRQSIGDSPAFYQRDKKNARTQENRYLAVNSNGSLNDRFQLETNPGGTVDFYIRSSCNGVDDSRNYDNRVTLANNGEASEPPSVYGDIGEPPDGQEGVGNNDENATCEASGLSLAWILCPVFNGLGEMTDWLFENIIEPFLYTSPISTNPSDPSYKAWSSFRVFANILLILAMLVIVFGQAIGGGAIDAYTAKKVLPKLLAAAILINLSIYIVNFLLDLTNVLGRGIGNILWAPFAGGGGGSFSLDTSQIVGGIGLGVMSLIVGGAGIAGFLFGVFGGGGMFIALAVVVPVILAFIGVFATLVIRQGLILFLIIASPIAFILYALPNGEQYFKKWWDILIKTLMMYPIIVIIFTMADILSITILRANSISNADVENIATKPISEPIAAVVAFVLQFLPLFLVPFAFKFAGSAVASIYGAISSGGKKVNEFTKGSKERARKKYNAASIQGRQRQYERLNKWSSNEKRSAFTRRLGQMGARTIAGADIEAEHSAQRAERMKELAAVKDTGRDGLIRGLTVNKRDAEARGDMRTAADGTREFRTLGGAWVKESDVDQGHHLYGGDHAAYQMALDYEMQKANTQEEQDHLFNGYAGLARSWSMDDYQAAGVWQGAAFQEQNQNRQWKHYSVGGDGELRNNALNLFREQDEKQGVHQMLGQNADTWTTMTTEARRAQRVLDGTATDEDRGSMTIEDAQEVLQRGARMAYQLEPNAVTPSGAAQAAQQAGGGAGLTPQAGYDPTSSAAGRVGEEARAFRDLFAEGGELEQHRYTYDSTRHGDQRAGRSAEDGSGRRRVPTAPGGMPPPARRSGDTKVPPPSAGNPVPPGAAPPNTRTHK